MGGKASKKTTLNKPKGGGGVADDDYNGNPNYNRSLQLPSHKLTGKEPVATRIVQNPLASQEFRTSAGYENVRILYRQTVEQLIQVFPEFLPVKDIHPESLSPIVVETLAQVYQRLSDHHSHLDAVLKERDHAQGLAHRYGEESKHNRHLLKTKDEEILFLVKDNAHLKSELKRGGQYHPGGRVRQISEGNANEEGSRRSWVGSSEDMTSRRLGQGMDPLAEERRTPYHNLIARNSSFRNSQRRSGGTHESRLVEDLTEKVHKLETLLELETKRNQKGIERSSRKQRNMIDDIVKKYGRLEGDLVNQVKVSVDRLVNYTDDRTKFIFLCDVMEEAYAYSTYLRKHLQERLVELLCRPTSYDDSKTSSLMRSGDRKLADSLKAKKLPDRVVDEINLFLQESAENVDVSEITQNIMVVMVKRYPDIVTLDLQTDHVTRSFVSECSRVAWQMAVTTPPMHLLSDTSVGFDDHYHNVYRSERNPGGRIDYYIWPVLQSRPNGDVLCNGLVHLYPPAHAHYMY